MTGLLQECLRHDHSSCLTDTSPFYEITHNGLVSGNHRLCTLHAVQRGRTSLCSPNTLGAHSLAGRRCTVQPAGPCRWVWACDSLTRPTGPGPWQDPITRRTVEEAALMSLDAAAGLDPSSSRWGQAASPAHAPARLRWLQRYEAAQSQAWLAGTPALPAACARALQCCS
jgi:hypothetical protein